jgi:hypothetical protein
LDSCPSRLFFLRPLGAAYLAAPGRQNAHEFRSPFHRDRLNSAKSFIDTHLAYPGLDTSMIGAAHHISARCLRKLFKADDLTVAD